MSAEHVHEWLRLGLANSDGSVSVPCRICGAEMIVHQGVIEHGFTNPLGLKFSDPDGLEWIILREIERDYRFDELAKPLGPDSVVVEIGAHVGVVSMWLARRYGCTVWAFEPAEGNYRRLVANIALNGVGDQVKAGRIAVTADGRDVTLVSAVDGNSGSYSIHMTDGLTRETAQSVTLGWQLQMLGKPIDLLKIDCEGAEFEILAEPELLRGRVGAIRGEFHAAMGDCQALLARVQAVVPDTRVTFQGWAAA